MTEPGHEATRSAIEAVWRIESPRLIAGLARITGDVGAAEELAQDALVIALEQWPVQGVPGGPGAWLMATAKHRAIDLIRRRASYERKLQEIGRDAALRPENSGEPDVDAMDDHIGDDLLRLIFIGCHPVLSPEARGALILRLLGGVLAGLMTRESEAHGLVALMELQASRVGARTDPAGEPVLLADQDRRRWDRLLIRHGLQALARATSLGGPPGPYEVQAEIAACHARAVSVGETDWERVAALYVVLGHLTPSPVVELNRAVAVGMAYGPARGLEIADRLTGHPALASYAHLPAVRGDLLAKLGRLAEAREEFGRAAALTGNERERALFRARADTCVIAVPGSG